MLIARAFRRSTQPGDEQWPSCRCSQTVWSRIHPGRAAMVTPPGKEEIGRPDEQGLDRGPCVHSARRHEPAVAEDGERHVQHDAGHEARRIAAPPDGCVEMKYAVRGGDGRHDEPERQPLFPEPTSGGSNASSTTIALIFTRNDVVTLFARSGR